MDYELDKYAVFYRVPDDERGSFGVDTDYSIFYAEDEDHAVDKFKARYPELDVLSVELR